MKNIHDLFLRIPLSAQLAASPFQSHIQMLASVTDSNIYEPTIVLIACSINVGASFQLFSERVSHPRKLGKELSKNKFGITLQTSFHSFLAYRMNVSDDADKRLQLK
jgi:hypothetical protein